MHSGLLAMTERIQRWPITAITHMPYSSFHAALSSLLNVVIALFGLLGLRISYNNKRNLDVNENLYDDNCR